MKPVAFLIGMVLWMTLTQCGQSGATNEEDPTSTQTRPSAPPALPDTLDLAYQDTLFLADFQDWLTFASLVHDSRCPTGVRCVWEGSAEVTFVLSHAGQEHAFSLNTHPTYTTDTTLSDLRIALLDLMPYPHEDSTYRDEQFSVRIFVDR